MYKIINDSEHNYLRLDPIPNEEIVEKYYKEDFYKEENKFFNDSSIEVQLKDKVFFNSRWERIYKICAENLGNLKGKRIYDIGFGFAQALLFLNKRD
jgi:hypothetical protein